LFYCSYLAQDLNDQTSIYLSALGGYTDVVEYLLSFRVSALTPQEVEQFKRRSIHNYSLSDSNRKFKIIIIIIIFIY